MAWGELYLHPSILNTDFRVLSNGCLSRLLLSGGGVEVVTGVFYWASFSTVFTVTDITAEAASLHFTVSGSMDRGRL